MAAVGEDSSKGAAPHRAANLMPVIVSDDIAAAGRIAAFVKSAAVVGFGADVVHLVEFEDVIVAADKHRLMRRIVDQVMCGPAAHAAQRQAVSGGELMLGETPDVVVQRFMAARSKRLSVAACQGQAAGADRKSTRLNSSHRCISYA